MRGLGPRALPADTPYGLWSAAQAAQAQRVQTGAGSAAASAVASTAAEADDARRAVQGAEEAAAAAEDAPRFADDVHRPIDVSAAASEILDDMEDRAAGGAATNGRAGPRGARRRTLEEMITARRQRTL